MTTPSAPPPYVSQFWAKSDRGDPARIHLLEHHLADVGACFEALLELPLIRRRLAHSGGLEGLDDAAAARLALLAALHDIGKANVGFQTRIWREADFPAGRRKPVRAGHIIDLQPVLNEKDRETAGWFFDELGWWWDEAIASWDDAGGETVCALFIAALSHHGRPLQLEGDRQPNPRVWRRYGGLDPAAAVRRIGGLVRRWFPAAFARGAGPLPSAPAFQHHFLGLCNLADWIGSNERWFPYADAPEDDYIDAARLKARGAVAEIGLNIAPQRLAFPDDLPSFATLFGFEANAIQRAAQEPPLDAPLVIIESETGSGKTEAALWRFARMYQAGLVDGLYFALPTRAAAKQIHDRVNRFVGAMFSSDAPEPVLAVPGYLQAGDVTGHHLHDYEVWWDDHATDGPRPDADGRRWAAESPRRFLAAQIAVGTIDQAMLGALKVKHAHLRSAALARNLLVVDEVHASDVYMSAVLEALLGVHGGAGGYALLMSATLGSAARHRWLRPGRRDAAPPLAEAMAVAYPAVSVRGRDGENIAAAGENGQDKEVGISAVAEMPDFAAVAGRALAAARAGAKVLVVRNTVGHAIDTQQALQALAGPGDAGLLFAVNGIATLHHGRFAAADRKRLDGEIETLLGRGRACGGMVVVGTQTLEQSLDIDADLLLTDLCPVDVLLQRIGRLHRHRGNWRPDDYARPRCIVLTPPEDDLSPLLKDGQDANGLGPHGYVYRSLPALEATRRLIAENPRWRIPQMNRELVERATHPDEMEAITAKMGPGWREHAINTAGGHLADRQTARANTINFGQSFYEGVEFPADDERILTRLGENRVELQFDTQPASPFDQATPIDRLSVRQSWLPGAKIPETVPPTPADGGFEFSVGAYRFRYDRLGLQRG